MFKEQRVEPREQLALPLKLAQGTTAVTRDISAGGLFFVIQGQHVLSGPIDFEMTLPEISLRFTSSGEIVRIEHEKDTTGVAIRFVNPHLDVLTQPPAESAGAARRGARIGISDPGSQPFTRKRGGGLE